MSYLNDKYSSKIVKEARSRVGYNESGNSTNKWSRKVVEKVFEVADLFNMEVIDITSGYITMSNSGIGATLIVGDNHRFDLYHSGELASFGKLILREEDKSSKDRDYILPEKLKEKLDNRLVNLHSSIHSYLDLEGEEGSEE